MKMVKIRCLELFTALAGCVLGVAAVMTALPLARDSSDYARAFTLWVLPEMLVAVGAYMHACRNISHGKLLLLLAGIVPAILTVQNVIFFGQLAYAVGWNALLLVATGAAVIITMILSLMPPK